jgi:DnaJ-class molecular chaperone
MKDEEVTKDLVGYDKDDDEKDTCTMCGGSGYLDLEQTQICPNCNGTGMA